MSMEPIIGGLGGPASATEAGAAAIKDSDQQAFAAAQTAFRQTSAQIEWLEKGGMTGRDSIRRTSRQVAGLVSAMLSGMMLIAMTLVYML